MSEIIVAANLLVISGAVGFVVGITFANWRDVRRKGKR